MSTIEDVLNNWWNPVTIHTIRSATADGPIRSEDGTLVVHRADPKLAADLNEWADEIDETGPWKDHSRVLRRAARLIAGDPEEEK